MIERSLSRVGSQRRPVTAEVTGSSPVGTAKSKRYSESLNQDFKNDSAESLRREWDFMGNKEIDTTPPSSVGTFHEGCLSGFVEIENRNNYSPIISGRGKCGSSSFGRAPSFQVGGGQFEPGLPLT